MLIKGTSATTKRYNKDIHINIRHTKLTAVSLTLIITVKCLPKNTMTNLSALNTKHFSKHSSANLISSGFLSLPELTKSDKSVEFCKWKECRMSEQN